MKGFFANLFGLDGTQKATPAPEYPYDDDATAGGWIEVADPKLASRSEAQPVRPKRKSPTRKTAARPTTRPPARKPARKSASKSKRPATKTGKRSHRAAKATSKATRRRLA